jgi:hypothetical protein
LHRLLALKWKVRTPVLVVLPVINMNKACYETDIHVQRKIHDLIKNLKPLHCWSTVAEFVSVMQDLSLIYTGHVSNHSIHAFYPQISKFMKKTLSHNRPQLQELVILLLRSLYIVSILHITVVPPLIILNLGIYTFQNRTITFQVYINGFISQLKHAGTVWWCNSP